MFSRVKVSIDFVKINLLPEYYKTKTKIFEASTLDLSNYFHAKSSRKILLPTIEICPRGHWLVEPLSCLGYTRCSAMDWPIIPGFEAIGLSLKGSLALNY